MASDPWSDRCLGCAWLVMWVLRSKFGFSCLQPAFLAAAGHLPCLKIAVPCTVLSKWSQFERGSGFQV